MIYRGQASDVMTDRPPTASRYDLTQFQTEDPEMDLRRRIGRPRVTWYFHIHISALRNISHYFAFQIHTFKRMIRLTVSFHDTRHSNGARLPLPQFRQNFFRVKVSHTRSSISTTPDRSRVREAAPGRATNQKTTSQAFSSLRHL